MEAFGTAAVERQRTNVSSIDDVDGYKGHDLVFVVGAPRSGTSWLQQLLASHPCVSTGQESGILQYVVPQLRIWQREMDRIEAGELVTGLTCYFNEAEFVVILRRYMFSLLAPMRASIPNGGLFIEKTPGHVEFLTEIGRLLPQAYVVHIVRDARDVTASIVAASRSWAAEWAPDDALKAAQMWAHYVGAARRGRQGLNPDRYFEVHYEDLVHDTRGTLLSLSTALGLEWTSDELEQALEKNTAKSAKAGRATPIPLYGEAATARGSTMQKPDDFVRKARVGSWREDLGPIARAKVWIAARHLMRDLGYEWRLPW